MAAVFSRTRRYSPAVGQISHPMTLREKMSMMTYKRNQIPRAGPFSLVISQDQTWFGPSAISSGFFLTGWVAWARRSPDWPRSSSSRYMVASEHR